MKINPEQSIKLFGWWDQPRSYVNWNDIKSKQLSWKTLRLEFGFTAEELYTLQRDKEEWIKRGQLTLYDVSDMRMFPIHPFKDMRADIGEIWNMKWSPDLLYEMGVTYEEMRDEGLSVEIMKHFGFPLSCWQKLGLKASHVTAEMSLIFGLDMKELCVILQEYPETPSVVVAQSKLPYPQKVRA